MKHLCLILAAVVAAAPAVAASADAPTPATRIENHRFTPAEIHVPANTAVMLTVTNADKNAEEFDSPALKVEKVLTGGSSGVVRLRPLRPGRYPFTGEYHADTAFGVVVVQ
jgi:heme/copper-type cytochrome/quinol oxidase subunit 2